MDYETAQNYIAWAEKAKTAAAPFVAMIAGSKCPMQITARDYDDTVKVIQEQIGEMFYTQLTEARRVVEKEERAELSRHMRQESTSYAITGRHYA